MHTQTGEMGQIWRNIGRLEASVGAILRRIDRVEREMRNSKAPAGLLDRISGMEKWIVRGIQIMLAGTTAWATGSISKGLEVFSAFLK